MLLATVQRHLRILSPEGRDKVLQYFQSARFFPFGWDVLVGYYTDQPDLFVAGNQVEHFFAEVTKHTGIAIDLLPDADRVNPDSMSSLKHLMKTTNSADFRRQIDKISGIKYDTHPAILQSPEERKKKKEAAAIKRVEKRLRVHEQREKMLNNIRKWIKERSHVFFCVDVEAYELDKRCVTEVGVAILDLKVDNTTEARPSTRHFRIEKYLHLRNTRYMNDASEKFDFGRSEIVSLDDCAAEVMLLYRSCGRDIAFVGHDCINDIRYLKTIGVDLPSDIPCADTLELWKLKFGENSPAALGTILNELDITAWNLHNAGNDAYYTVRALMKMFLKTERFRN
ncbi:uncharacterized protein V1518DRAFT_188663 [Limtongia smithiae]|uniref:uncharacterized protein n=1 Tax=Limtongia smithiae TaxID=1125753 RepID=UPI0034CEF290